jgi:hypothetical protein
MEVIKGNGPFNRQRMANRRRAHSDGAWVREAALAYAAKQAQPLEAASERVGAAASGPERSGGKTSPMGAARASEPRSTVPS